jgi:hypothetical protein
MADQTATIQSKYVEKTNAEFRRQFGFTHVVRIPYTEVYDATKTTQGDTKTLTLFTTPVKFFVRNVAIDIKTAFATTGTLTVAIGLASDPDNLIDEITAKTAGFRIDALGGDPLTLTGSFGSSAVAVTAQFATQASTGALSDITAGDMYVFLDVVDVSEMLRPTLTA